MDQNTNIKELIHRLYKKDFISEPEIKELDAWLSQLKTDQKFDSWLQFNWQSAEDVPVDISFEGIQRLVLKKAKKPSGQKIIMNKFQRIAAILVIPLFLASTFLVYQKFNTPEKWVSLKTEKGERTHVTLPDGSEVWINVDSEIQYSTAYHESNRTLKLSGEAFFKVAKQQKNPFVVEAKNFQVKAIGTEFGVFAYSNEPESMTFLKEGIVDVNILGNDGSKIRMQPGQKSIIYRVGNEIVVKSNTLNSDMAWTVGRLVFQDEEIPIVFRKIERWYNITISYKTEEFLGETLFVNLNNGETLDNVLRIIDDAIGIDVIRNGNQLTIEKKIKRANS